MKGGRGGGKEHEVPTHLVENSKLTHAARVTSGSSQMSNHMLCWIDGTSVPLARWGRSRVLGGIPMAIASQQASLPCLFHSV